MCNCNKEYELLPELEVLLNEVNDFEASEVSAGTRNSKDFIRWVQRNLNRVLRLKTPLPVNGVMTARTKDAIKLFQRRSGISPTGTVDDATLAAIEKAAGVTAPVHTAMAPADCTNGRDISADFRRFITAAKNMVTRIT